MEKSENLLLSDPTLYCKLVGSLMYLTIICPDISFVVQQVSQFMASPRHLHITAVKRIICYIKGTSMHGLLFPIGAKLQLSAYSDVDYASYTST